jgi:hypothetical protein
VDAGLQYWQQMGQQEQAEQESLIECMEWYEARRDQFNSQESLTQGIDHGIPEGSEKEGEAPFGTDRTQWLG